MPQKSFSCRLTWLDGILLALLCAVAAVPRLWGMGAESVSWDEFTSLTHLGEPTLRAFLTQNRSLDPVTLPAYYTLEYLWWNYVAASVQSLRLLSVILGSGTLVLLYGLGHRLFGRTGAVVAALCLALSPVHAFHAQDIRMYVLFVFLAAASMWGFVAWLENARKTALAGHCVASFFLSWTHPFAGLVLAVQAFFLLVYFRRYGRRAIAWFGLQTILWLPAVLYVAQLKYWPEDQTGQWLRFPGLGVFLGDLLADDVIGLSWQLRTSTAPWAPLSWRPVMDALLFCAGPCAMALLAWRAWGRSSARKEEGGGALTPRARFVLLVLWVIVPVLALAVLSLVIRPCIFPRYTVHASLGLYLLLGGAVAALPMGGRVISALLLAVLLGYQDTLVRPGPMRPDWRGAAVYIEDHAHADDLILVQRDIWREVFLYNLGETAWPVAAAEQRPLLAAMASFYFEIAGGQVTPPTVWCVVPTAYFDSGPDNELEAALGAAGLNFSWVFFPGIKNILVYAVQSPEHPPEYVPDVTGPSYAEAFGDLAMALALQRKSALALATLDHLAIREPSDAVLFSPLREALVEGRPPESAVRMLRAYLRAAGFRENGQLDFAEASFQKLVEKHPDFALAWSALGQIEAARGNADAARHAIEKALALDPTQGAVYSGLLDMLEKGEDVGEALEAVELLHQGKTELSGGNAAMAMEHLNQATQMAPQMSAAWLALGCAHAAAGDSEPALAALARGIDLDPTQSAVYEGLQKALRSGQGVQDAVKALELLAAGFSWQKAGRPDTAAALFRQVLQLDSENNAARHALGRALIEAGQLREAAAVFQSVAGRDPADALLYAHVGDVLEQGKSPADALFALDRVLDAVLQLGRGDTAAALADFEAAMQRDSTYGAAYAGMALVHKTRGDLAAMLDILRKGFEADPEGIGRWRGYIEAAFARGDIPAARREAENLARDSVYVPESFLEPVS